MITKIFDKDGVRYEVGENGVKEIDDFSGALGYPNFTIYFTDGKRRIIYSPNMNVDIENKE